MPECTHYTPHSFHALLIGYSLQLFVNRRGFRLGVLKLQPNLLAVKEAPVVLWLPLHQQPLQPCSQCSPAPPPPLDPATLQLWSSDSSPRQAAQAVPLIRIATYGSLQYSVPTVLRRNGETLKERYIIRVLSTVEGRDPPNLPTPLPPPPTRCLSISYRAVES